MIIAGFGLEDTILGVRGLELQRGDCTAALSTMYSVQSTKLFKIFHRGRELSNRGHSVPAT